jgi:tRNA G18 (ribose-2'-O)-methylase SpoU
MRLNAEQLRRLEEERAKGVIRQFKRNPIYFILEDIYDTYNIGGLFRLADALAVEKMYLVGETETPPNSRIKKASIGTYKIVPWEYYKSVKDVIADLKSKIKNQQSKIHIKNQKVNDSFNLTVIAVEQNPNSVPYYQANYSFPLALIFGHESYGIKP